MNPPPLLRAAPHEADHPTAASLREAFVLLRPRLQPPFSFAIPSPSEYASLTRAIAYGALTEPDVSRAHFVHLHSIVTDGYKLFTGIILEVVHNLYPKLLDPPRLQIIRLLKCLIDVEAVGVEKLVVALLRRINGGDFSESNLWLASELLGIFNGRWEWLVQEQPAVAANAVFVYLRLLADHYRLGGDGKVEALKRMEVDFCVRVLREQFGLCLGIGRDLIRLLQDVAFIPEFRLIWRDLLFNPSTFGVVGFSDVSQIYRTRTPSRYFLLRVSAEMETQMRFLLSHVKWGCHRRYQEWFGKKFLCRPEQEAVIIDLIRFICCAHHPPNEIIQSDVIARWAVIGWLLKCCRRNYFEANAKLALFYDWLFFDDAVDNIMNIEPAILLMVHSIPQYIDLTKNLMEFLFLLVDNYDVSRKEIIFQGVSTAFGALLKKGVIHSLDPFLSSKLISQALKDRIVAFLKQPSTLSKLIPFRGCTCKDPLVSGKSETAKEQSALVKPEEVKEPFVSSRH